MNRVDTVFAGYLVASGVVIAAHARELSMWLSFFAVHFLLASAILSLRRHPRVSSRLGWFRDWYPVFAFPLLYKEVELLARAFGNWGLTGRLQELEVSLFGGHPSLYLATGLPSVALSEYLHLCYVSFVLWVPLLGGLWYLTRRREGFHELMFLVSLTFLGSYLFFILFPVDSPFYLFEPLGRPQAGRPFYELVHFVSSRGGARGGAFPSTHVSVSTVVWLVAFRHDRRIALWLAPVYVGLVAATVYGRFHYAVDVVAGWCLALVVFTVAGRSRDGSPDAR